MSDWRDRAGTTFTPYKQPATGSQGMVSTNHPLGSAAGLEMLAMGGNAVDAAIAAVFALSVVEPMMVGPLGGGYINLRKADGTSLCIDNYTMAPGTATTAYAIQLSMPSKAPQKRRKALLALRRTSTMAAIPPMAAIPATLSMCVLMRTVAITAGAARSKRRPLCSQLFAQVVPGVDLLRNLS